MGLPRLLCLLSTLLILLSFPIQASVLINTRFDSTLLSSNRHASRDIYTADYADFNIVLSRSFLNVARGLSGVVEATLSGTNGFSDTVALSTSISPAPGTPTTDCISVNVEPDVVTLSPAQPTADVVLTFFAFEPYLYCYPPLGTYNVSVFGTAQTPPRPTHEARMTLTFLDPALQGAYLLFELGYRGPPYPGATIQLVSNFTNIGSVQLKVTALSIATDLGTFSQNSGLPLDLTLEQKETLTVPMAIPSGTPPGDYQVSATAQWQYFNMTGWAGPRFVAVNGNMSVVQPSPWSLLAGLGPWTSIILVVLLGYVATTSLVVGLVIRREHLRRQALAKSLAA